MQDKMLILKKVYHYLDNLNSTMSHTLSLLYPFFAYLKSNKETRGKMDAIEKLYFYAALGFSIFEISSKLILKINTKILNKKWRHFLDNEGAELFAERKRLIELFLKEIGEKLEKEITYKLKAIDPSITIAEFIRFVEDPEDKNLTVNQKIIISSIILEYIEKDSEIKNKFVTIKDKLDKNFEEINDLYMSLNK